MPVSLVRPFPADPYTHLPPVPSFTLTSEDVRHEEVLPARHGGPPLSNVSPHLRWEGFPAQTRSFVVTAFDPDALGPAGWWHWLVMDVPVTTTELLRGAGSPDAERLPPGAFQLRGDDGVAGYVGAAPPAGDRAHRYLFAVHALDTEHVPVGPESMPGAASVATVLHTIARGVLLATSQR